MKIIKGILMAGGVLFFLCIGAFGIAVSHDAAIVIEECNKEVREDDRNFCLENPYLHLKENKDLWFNPENM